MAYWKSIFVIYVALESVVDGIHFRKRNSFNFELNGEARANISCKCFTLFMREICKGSTISYVEKGFSDPDICCRNCSDRSMFITFCPNGTLNSFGKPILPLNKNEFYTGQSSCKYISRSLMSEKIRQYDGFGICLDELDSLCPGRKKPNKFGLHHQYNRQREQLRRQHGSTPPRSSMALIPTLPPRVTRFSYL